MPRLKTPEKEEPAFVNVYTLSVGDHIFVLHHSSGDLKLNLDRPPTQLRHEIEKLLRNSSAIQEKISVAPERTLREPATLTTISLSEVI